MIEIKSERTEAGIVLEMNIHGRGEDLAPEAAIIMKQLPKRIKETSNDLFELFKTELEQYGYEIKEVLYDKSKAKRVEGLS